MGKVITGILRAGKSFLLLTIYRQYLLSQGVSADHIIAIALDDIKFKELRDSEKLCHYIANLVSDKEGMYPISSDAFSTDNLLYGISARIAAEYMFNSRLYAGLEGCYRYYLGPSAVKNAQTIRANLMVGVRF